MSPKIKKLLESFRVVNQLECAHRYSQIQLTREENVMEHTGFVCMYVYLLWFRFMTVTGSSMFNLGLALQKAVCHDIDEVITGDVPRTTKYASESIRLEFQSLEARGVSQIALNLCLHEHDEAYDTFLGNWQNAKSNTSEGLIVKYVDLIAVVYRLWAEVILKNNMCMMPVATGVQKYLKEFESKLEDSADPVVGLILDHMTGVTELVDVICAKDDPLYHTLAQ